jgi:hypothetical protein
MQLTIELPDHLATQLQAIPNLNEFMAKLVTQSLSSKVENTQEYTQRQKAFAQLTQRRALRPTITFQQAQTAREMGKP